MYAGHLAGICLAVALPLLLPVEDFGDTPSEGAFYRAVETSFKDRSVSRARVAEAFEEVLRKYPKVEDAARLRGVVDLLKRMVAEDEAYARRRPARGGKPSRHEQIAELIFQLRDTYDFNGEVSNPDLDDSAAATTPHRKPTPARRLVELGYDAVPQLIAALQDERPTRSFEPDVGRSGAFVRVGDVAKAVLEQIAGRHFSDGGIIVETGKVKRTQDKARAWWRDLQRKGERHVLAEGAAAGDVDSTTQAERLVKKFPSAALEPIRQGVGRARDEGLRASLVVTAGGLKGGPVVQFLRSVLRDPDWEVRLTAARCLLEHGSEDGMPVAIDDWNRFSLAAGRDQRDPPRVISDFLASCGKPYAIRALACQLHRRRVPVRMEVIEALGTADVALGERPFPADVREARDAVLVEALHDTAECLGTGGNWGNGMVWDPRLCDLAAHFLVQAWKRARLFNTAAPLRTRDRQLIEVKNVWLARHRLPTLPLPAPRKSSPAVLARLQPLLRGLREARTSAERDRALAAVAALGLPALPALRDALRDWPVNHPAYEGLQRATDRVALTITEAELVDRAGVTSDDWLRRVPGCVGEELTEKRLLTLLDQLRQPMPAGIRGFRLDVWRPGDDSGVCLRVTLVPVGPREPTGAGQWNAGGRVYVEGKETGTSGWGVGGGHPRRGVGTRPFQQLVAPLRTALQTPPGQEILVKMYAVYSWHAEQSPGE